MAINPTEEKELLLKVARGIEEVALDGFDSFPAPKIEAIARKAGLPEGSGEAVTKLINQRYSDFLQGKTR